MVGGMASGQAVGSAAKCSALAALKLEGAVVTSAALVPSGAPMAGVELKTKNLPAICRVKVQDKPSADSITLTEVWLPVTGWNGKLHGIGNGGFAGNIYFDQMAANLIRGDAVSGTDAGHEGMDASFALGHPERVKDFGWRAVHDTAVVSKTLLQAFYGIAASHSYFTACSDGGREALMEAQRFPADYDGILAGAPANNWTALVSSGAQDEHVLRASTASDIPVSKLPAIGAAVRAACDALDGVKDGVLNDPRACHFDPGSLLCKQADAPDCLTAPQVASLKEIYSAKKEDSGMQVFPGYLPGAEDAQGGWAGWLLGDPAATVFFSDGYFKDFVYADPSWRLSTFQFNAAYKAATEKTAAALNATDPNLKAFAARGGKLIVYHGWNDPAIPSLSSVEYYDRVRAEMGGPATDGMMRLYMVPGMLHCDGGPGATEIGQDESQPRGDAEHDVATALEQWVELGKAPGTIVADGNGMTRPICVWPEVAQYSGGDTKSAASFKCEKQATSTVP
jgi:feruloyl esterase